MDVFDKNASLASDGLSGVGMRCYYDKKSHRILGSRVHRQGLAR